MDIRPILSTLLRHKTAASLIVLEIALTFAIVCNAVFLIASRLDQMNQPSGIAEQELVRLRLGTIARVDNADALTVQDLATLRALPGVTSAAIVNQSPFASGSSQTSTINLAPDQEQPTLLAWSYRVGEDTVATMGLRVVEGRDFLPDEFRTETQTVADPTTSLPALLLTRATAERLFPGQSAVGQTVYTFNDRPSRVVGIVEQLMPPPSGGSEGNDVMILPVRQSYRGGAYLLRVDPARRAEVMRAAAAALEALDSRRIVVEQDFVDDQRREHYRQDRWMIGLLVAVCAALLLVTAFGIVGLASFWVQQRTRMIGVRRALGASRGQILRYFQTENLLLTTIGIALGVFGAYAINEALMQRYEFVRLPWTYLPAGAAVLWLLGQVAVLGPARRAATLPPVAVMRGA